MSRAKLCSMHLLCQRLSCCLHDATCDAVGIAIGSRAAVFHVAFSISFCRAGNSNRGPTVGNTKLEIFDAACLVFPGEALVITLAILCDVLRCHLTKSLT